MEYEEDMLDALDGESEEDNFYDEDDSNMVDDDDDCHSASDEENRPEKIYAILKESDIRQRQEVDISHVSSVLSVSKVEACTLLCHYKWNISQLHDEWFADERKVRDTVGLPSGPVVSFPNAEELTCGICFDSCPPAEMRSAVCGHLYCITCWKGYILLYP